MNGAQVLVRTALAAGREVCFAHPGTPRHTYLTLTGGAIGQGLPTAVGAAIACPDRPVLALQADGSALHTTEALWTMAREQLGVTVPLCANRRYNIRPGELARAGASEPGRACRTLTDLRNPTIDWGALSRGYGAPATQASNAEQMSERLLEAMSEPAPHLVELVL